MQAFLGRRYGTTVARIVADGAGKEYSVDPAKGGAQVSTGQVLVEGSEGIAGTVVLVVRRQLANMAARIGQRIVGSILSRLVSVVAGGVGLVLIAKDIWDFRHGVLPIIADEMKSKATKDKVREELAKSIAEQINDSLKEISDKTAERVVEIWLEFRRAHAKVVELAERQDGFKRFLDTVKADDMPRLDEIVALVLAERGRGRRPQAARRRHAASRRHRPAAGGRSRSRARRARSRRRCNGRRLPATACPRWSNTRCIAAPSPRTSPRPACSACSGWRTGSPSRGSRPCTPAARDAAVRAGDGRAEVAGARARRGPARQPVALPDEPRQGLRPARAAGGGADAGAHGRARQARACAMPSSPRSDQAAAVGMMLQASSLPDPEPDDGAPAARARRPREPAAAVGEAPGSRWWRRRSWRSCCC